ncbi:MAG: hypothetical protein ACYC4N_23590 [Pirellulaceae bacterium]
MYRITRPAVNSCLLPLYCLGGGVSEVRSSNATSYYAQLAASCEGAQA